MTRNRSVRGSARAFVTAATTVAAGLALLGLGLAGWWVTAGALEGLLDAAAVGALRARWTRSFAILAVVALAGIAAAVFAAATAVTRALDRLRADIDRARSGGAAPPRAAGGFTEVQAVGAAAERLAAEAGSRATALQRERDRFARLVDAVSEAILQVGADGRLVHANPAARAALRLPRSVEGAPLAAILRHGELRAVWQRAAAGERPPATELGIDSRRFLVTATPLGGDAGVVLGLVDLTEIRRLEGVRRDFVANVSHEMKTPLTSIRGYVETLMADDVPAATRAQFLEVIRNNADRLQRIIDDLLDLSRLESGGWRPEPRPVDAAAAAAEAWAACANRAGARGIRFEIDGEAMAVRADPGGLGQILTNLFDNAIRHTPDGGSIRVRLLPMNGSGDSTAASAANGRVAIEIRDTGTGIPKDALPRIFERFYRVDPARSRADGGTGLGLSIVKHLVERMGGSITAESELGKGTTIRIVLPAA